MGVALVADYTSSERQRPGSVGRARLSRGAPAPRRSRPMRLRISSRSCFAAPVTSSPSASARSVLGAGGALLLLRCEPLLGLLELPLAPAPRPPPAPCSPRAAASPARPPCGPSPRAARSSSSIGSLPLGSRRLGLAAAAHHARATACDLLAGQRPRRILEAQRQREAHAALRHRRARRSGRRPRSRLQQRPGAPRGRCASSAARGPSASAPPKGRGSRPGSAAATAAKRTAAAAAQQRLERELGHEHVASRSSSARQRPGAARRRSRRLRPPCARAADWPGCSNGRQLFRCLEAERRDAQPPGQRFHEALERRRSRRRAAFADQCAARAAARDSSNAEPALLARPPPAPARTRGRSRRRARRAGPGAGSSAARRSSPGTTSERAATPGPRPAGSASGTGASAASGGAASGTKA